MLDLQNISKTYNDSIVLDNISLSINHNDVIALIGLNGAGKTTLLRILLGEVTPDEGRIVNYQEVVGYISQELDRSTGTVGGYFEKIDSWRADNAMSVVGMDQIESNQSLDDLSGGQKTRIALAKTLAKEPEPTILLLDEPTNNLDSEGLDWLENFINKFNGAVLLVSHDRHFINAVANRVIEIKDGKMRQYGGNYDFYKSQKETELQSDIEKYRKNQDEKKRLKKAMVIQKENSKHVHEHIKRTDNDKFQKNFFRNRVSTKLGSKAKSLETRLENLDTVKPPLYNKAYRFSLSGMANKNKLLVRLNNVYKIFSRKVILSGVDIEVTGNLRLHIKGLNGSGKSTLLRIIAGRLSPDIGEVSYSEDVTIGYFSQDTDGLDYSQTALDNLLDSFAENEDIYRQARSMGLDIYDLQKMPSELSRGQQSKLAFTKLLLANHELLILDEPTNHLDITTKELLETALKGYGGALVIASHDEYFLSQIRIDRSLLMINNRAIEG